MSCPCTPPPLLPPPPLPHRCLIHPLRNWDAETLTELIYGDGELCNVEENTDYYINTHTSTHPHAQRQADTHMLVKENVIWHHVWRASSIVLREFVLVVSYSQGGRGENMPGDCFLQRWIVCSGVYYEDHTSVWPWVWLAIEIGLLRCPVLSLRQQITHAQTNQTQKKKTNKNINSERFITVKVLINVWSFCVSNITPPILPTSGRQRRWFILLRQRTAVTHMRTHTHTHTHAQEHWGLLSYTSH